MPVMMSSAAVPLKTFRASRKRFRARAKPFAFPPESLFAFSPESCSSSPRNRFRVHPGILFVLPRNPQLVKVGLEWANFLVLRRTHATLMKALGVDGKLVADQLGHSLDVSQNVYTQSPVETRLAGLNQLEKSLAVN